MARPIVLMNLSLWLKRLDGPMDWQGLSWQMCSWLVWSAACSAVIIYTDIRYYWIPDVMVLLLSAANGAACLLGLAFPDILPALASVLLLAAVFWLVPGSIGGGDIKLLAALCLTCTGEMLYVMLCVSFLTGLAGALVVLWQRQERIIPFAPFLLGGWWFSLFWGQECYQWLAGLWLG